MLPRLLAALTLLFLAGCGAEPPLQNHGDLYGTLQRLSEAGYDWTSVGHSHGADGIHRVGVELRTKTEPKQQAASRAAQLVWTTHNGPLDAVKVEVNGEDVLYLTRYELTDQFGPRDQRLDAPAPQPADDRYVVVWTVVLTALGLVGVVIIVVKLRRRRAQPSAH